MAEITRVGIWIADMARLRKSGMLEGARRILSPQDLERMLRFALAADRDRFAAGRLLVRALAKREFGNLEVELGHSAWGKPFFVKPGAIRFNLSHSGNAVVLAFGDCSVGVDVEERKDMDWRCIAAGFGKEERAFIGDGPDAQDRFYAVWTAREAFAKEEGAGLSVFDDADARFDFESKTVRLGDKTLHLGMWDLPGAAMSLCADRPFEARISMLSEKDLIEGCQRD